MTLSEFSDIVKITAVHISMANSLPRVEIDFENFLLIELYQFQCIYVSKYTNYTCTIFNK